VKTKGIGQVLIKNANLSVG